jgi:predicted dehydrogenase
MNRRHFLGSSTAALSSLTIRASAPEGSNQVTVGIMGMGTRGKALARALAPMEGIRIAWIVEPDKNRLAESLDLLGKAQPKGKSLPSADENYQRILDDKSVDALIVTAPNHWHAPATILGCAAGKHVYVEKPCCHNPQEGLWMIEAAKKHGRLVQTGTQRRSWTGIQEAMQRLREGEIGELHAAQTWYYASRGSIGKGMEAATPEGLNYPLWEGPAPHRPFRTNYLHYNWHWFWHWGNGELGNNGIHWLDLARWGMGVTHPELSLSTGGRYYFNDDQETPDTHLVSFEFPGRKMITWEGHSCQKETRKEGPDVLFLGSKGRLALSGAGYTVQDPTGKEIAKGKGTSGEGVHLANFIGAIRGNNKLSCPLEEAVPSTLLCHLGNIAHRTKRTLKTDATTGNPIDPLPAGLWRREYASGFPMLSG